MCPILFVGRHMRPRQGHAWGGLCFTEWSGRLVMLRWGGQDDRFTQIIMTMIQQDYNGDHSGEDPQHSEREARAGDRDLICCLPRWEGGVVVGVVVVLGVNRDLMCCLSRWEGEVPLSLDGDVVVATVVFDAIFCFVKVAFPVKIFCLPTRRKKRKNLNLKSAPWWKLKKRVSQDPVLAVEAVQVVDENVDQDQAVYSHLRSFAIMLYIFFKPLELIRGIESFILMSTFSGSSSWTRPQDKSRAWVLLSSI